ncbi:hypothetical protein SLS62_003409 [Diatrype stigma]|uniref:Ribosomal protein S35, mitochondrial n=1 Tax=Diatrype stigma TaxID=117547 RepID=A0AAN9YUP7_9PEZI
MQSRTLSTTPVALSALARPTRPECLVARPGRLLQCAATASFSTTASREVYTKSRRDFFDWMKRKGKDLKHHKPGETNYIMSKYQPFPFNPLFRSQSVLSDGAREIIWEKIMKHGESIKAVSAEFGVDIRRVAAVVRLKEVEKDWEAKKKPLARPYARAVLDMLPTKNFSKDMQNTPFEPINELHVHPYTMQQIFWPTSESRQFTREDAAKAFHHTMLSADKRVPHPELIQMEREIAEGKSPYEASENFKKAAMESEAKAAARAMQKTIIAEKYTTRVKSPRFEFRFRQVNAELVGAKGKARNAVGWKYGAPSYDRAKGQIKIPTSVP